jgi:hypothetical protein
MRVMMPFGYGKLCKVKGKSKPVEIAFADWVERDVPEFDGDQAPVVARWTARSRGPGGEERRDTRTCRRIGDGFFMPAGYDRNAPIPADRLFRPGDHKGKQCLDLLSLVGMHYGSPAYHACDALVEGKPEWTQSTRGDLQVVTVLKDHRHYHLGQAEKLMDRLALVEGGLWIKVREPKLRLAKVASEPVDTASITIHTEAEHNRKVDGISTTCLFALDRVDELYEHARRCGFAVRDDVEVETVAGAAFPFDTDRWLAERAGWFALNGLEESLGNLPAAAVEKWLYMRDVLGVGLADGDDADLFHAEVEALVEEAGNDRVARVTRSVLDIRTARGRKPIAGRVARP